MTLTIRLILGMVLSSFSVGDKFKKSSWLTSPMTWYVYFLNFVPSIAPTSFPVTQLIERIQNNVEIGGSYEHKNLPVYFICRFFYAKLLIRLCSYVVKKARLQCWLPTSQKVLHQRWMLRIHCTQGTKHPPWLWIFRADITSPKKQGYQWSTKRTCVLQTFEKKVIFDISTTLSNFFPNIRKMQFFRRKQNSSITISKNETWRTTEVTSVPVWTQFVKYIIVFQCDISRWSWIYMGIINIVLDKLFSICLFFKCAKFIKVKLFMHPVG